MPVDVSAQRRIALLSTSDTDLLSARSSGALYSLGNPARQELEPLLHDAEVVVLRVLGSSAEIEPELAVLRGSGLPLVVLGGERQPSPELMECSTVPIGLAAQAHAYLAEGGPSNLGQLHAFLCDTVLLTGEGFEEPVTIPEWGFGRGYSTAHGD
ncbi:MAG: cobaltochelatase subunit CobN, partial [Acidimicrobiales bacterium]